LAPLAQDLIVVGQDKLEIGVLIFPDTEALASAGYSRENSEGAATCPLLLSEMTRRLTERANQISGSSNHVGRALVVSELPSMGHGEITAKGSLNSLKILERRSTLLKRLYDDEDPAVARIAGTELAAEI
jgi:feruloyl-CoA synthase